MHETWQAEGAGQRWFIKLCAGPDWPPQRVCATLAAQQHLAEAGLPVPRVRRTLAGELAAAAAVGGEGACPTGGAAARATLAVMDFLPGHTRRPQQIPAEAAFTAGAMLGRLHHALAALPPGPPAVPDRGAVRQEAEAVLAAACERVRPDAMDQLAMEAARYRLTALEAGHLAPAQYGDAAWQWVHGDYYPANLLWSEDQHLTGVVDFDFCGPRWRGLEVGRAAVETALLPDWAFRRPVAEAFLTGYQESHPLPLAERRGLFRLWYNHLLSSLYPLSLRYQEGQRLPHGWDRLARRRHGLLLWLGEHLAELEGLAGGV